jgi:hypothetical protein
MHMAASCASGIAPLASGRRPVQRDHDSESARAGEVAFGPGFEQCWTGDPDQPSAITRLGYHEMFVPRAVERIGKTAPDGADLTSWRY